MEKEELLEKIAPCSLICYTCGAYEQGAIPESARILWNHLEGVREFYMRHCPNKVERFCIFAEELQQFADGKCAGCRSVKHHGCSIEGCFILECTKEHGVNFCGECSQFPCDKVDALFEKEVYVQWLEGNKKIKFVGIDEFWKQNRSKPHYASYKNGKNHL